MVRIGAIAAALIALSTVADADPISDHFLGAYPICATLDTPTIIITDVTRSGEIDDTVSLLAYRRLEMLGCVKVAAVVSIFGNGGSSTRQVHENLVVRLAQLGIDDWPVLHGPDRRVPFGVSKGVSTEDRAKLESIASVVRSHESVVIAELGPFTVSARLLMHGILEPERVERILGVGGRAPGEQLSTGKGLPFAFRDMNVAEDREAIRYLLYNHPQKLWLVTYRTGIGERMVDPEALDFGDAALKDHVKKRAAKLKLVGYSGMIPSWDTWTTSYFLQGGPERLACRKTAAQMRQADGFKPTDSMQLQLLDAPDRHGRFVTACHQIANR